MQSGKIIPVIRQFFTPTNTIKSTNRDTNGGTGQQYQQQPQREATEEEIYQAADLLSAQDDFKSSGIRPVVERVEGKITLLVKDKNGVVLRTFTSQDILRILQNGKQTSDSHRLGRILDRKV